MWLTSKTPTARRTALCSSMTPEYWTGMSHPPKSTILAPRARCTEFKGVTRSDGAADMKIQANRSFKRSQTREGKPGKENQGRKTKEENGGQAGRPTPRRNH